MNYHRMTPADRYRIEGYLQSDLSIRAIARKLNRSPSSISREIKSFERNGRYRAEFAINKSVKLRWKNKRRFKIHSRLKKLVTEKILIDWSPAQISAWLKTKDIALSKQTIYRFIEREKKTDNTLTKHLRILRKERQDRKKPAWKPPSERLTKRTWIDERPKIVNKRSRLGDFERDTVFGKINGPLLLTLVDRTSRYAKIEWVEKKCSILIHEATVRALKNEVLHTITNDNGTEFVKHEMTAEALKTKIYFSRAYRSWERGTNENFNGLLRQYFPRRKCIGRPTRRELDRIEKLINSRPKKVLGWKTPLEVHRLKRSQVLR